MDSIADAGGMDSIADAARIHMQADAAAQQAAAQHHMQAVAPLQPDASAEIPAALAEVAAVPVPASEGVAVQVVTAEGGGTVVTDDGTPGGLKRVLPGGVPQPRGRPRLGHRWDSVAGEWVPDGAGPTAVVNSAEERAGRRQKRTSKQQEQLAAANASLTAKGVDGLKGHEAKALLRAAGQKLGGDKEELLARWKSYSQSQGVDGIAQAVVQPVVAAAEAGVDADAPVVEAVVEAAAEVQVEVAAAAQVEVAPAVPNYAAAVPNYAAAAPAEVPQVPVAGLGGEPEYSTEGLPPMPADVMANNGMGAPLA